LRDLTAMRRGPIRGSTVALAVVVAAVLAGSGVGSSAAVEVPPAGGGFYIQTSGPNAGAGIGDWYSSNAAGAGNGYDYLLITVPCGWPSATPLYIDLFSPEINANALPGRDEPRGIGDDSTEFELYGPGAVVGPGYNLPAPGTGIVDTTYVPELVQPEAWVRFATLAPVTCGTYVVRSAVIGAGDDDNGWRIRVGTDNDNDPTNAPPANSDDPDGLPGTNDEIVIGQVQTSYQQSTGGVACLTLFEYVSAGQASVTFNNYDMDGNTRVRYYAPSDTFDPTGLSGGTVGTLSNNAAWNGGVGLARGGDTIANPEGGWWRIVSCLTAVNQFIQEAQNGVDAYYAQPPIPAMTLTKDDGAAVAPAGGDLTYTVTATNTSSGGGAGAALAVVITDTIPTNSTYQSCAIVAPATGTCSESLGVVTAMLDDWINAGDSAAIHITVTVDPNASGTITNDASVAFEDGLGNPFPAVTASDIDAAGPPLPTATPIPTSTPTPTPNPAASTSPTPIPSVPDAALPPNRGYGAAVTVIAALAGILIVGLLALASSGTRRRRAPRRRIP
jgi:uncharacterized repeat protein (TIGR01451 family)